MKEYFESKSSKDFKNSKKFCQFYSSTIMLKSDKSTDDLKKPSSLTYENNLFMKQRRNWKCF